MWDKKIPPMYVPWPNGYKPSHSIRKKKSNTKQPESAENGWTDAPPRDRAWRGGGMEGGLGRLFFTGGGKAPVSA